jgi:hypothetical protein
VHARAEVAERNATKTLTQVLETLRRPKQSHIDLTDARALRTEHHAVTPATTGGTWKRVDWPSSGVGVACDSSRLRPSPRASSCCRCATTA